MPALTAKRLTAVRGAQPLRALALGAGESAATGYGDDFVLVMATTTAAETVTIPCANVGTFNAIIDWGDGSTSAITAYNDADLAHEYATAGDHTIRISGAFPNIVFNDGGDKLKLKKILNWGDTGFEYLERAFWGCSNLTEATSNGNTNVSANTHRLMFRGCSKLAEADVSQFKISFSGSVGNTISGMFKGCSLLPFVDVSSFDTSACSEFGTVFHGAFESCGALENLSIFDWDITSLAEASRFLLGSDNALTTAQYDAVLVAWEAQAYNSNVPIHFGDATYTAGSAAATARAQLVTDGWTITDGGTA